MVSMKDIAKACGVSVATVSKALSGQPDIGEQTRELICKTADALGYLSLIHIFVSRVLGVSPSSAYELLHEDGFPSLRIGSRLVVPKEQFRLWVELQTGGTHEE